MLGAQEMMAFVATAEPEVAKRFYCDVLGLALLEETPFALVLHAGGTTLRVQKVQGFTPHPFTSLGWKVADIAGVANQLSDKGVDFIRFDGLGQDERGIWTAPNGDRVAWFKDPDGNILSLTQF